MTYKAKWEKVVEEEKPEQPPVEERPNAPQPQPPVK